MLLIAPLFLGMFYTFAGYGIFKLFVNDEKIIIIRDNDENDEKKI